MLLNGALIPVRFTHPDHNPFVGAATSPRALTLVTSLFLHSGLVHLGFNMFSLFAVGRLVEAAIGPRRFLLLYSVAGLAGGLATIVLYRNEAAPFIGASGAIAGVFAGFLLLLPPGAERTKSLVWVLAFTLLPALIPSHVIEGVTGSGFLAQIAYWSHVGGFLGGGLVMYLFILRARRRRATSDDGGNVTTHRAIVRHPRDPHW